MATGQQRPAQSLIMQAIDWLFEQPAAREFDELHGQRLAQGQGTSSEGEEMRHVG